MIDFTEEMFLQAIKEYDSKLRAPDCMHIIKDIVSHGYDCYANWYQPFSRIEMKVLVRRGKFVVDHTEFLDK